MSERELCLDIETTGLDPKDGHRIIEIACVELVNKVKTGNFFHSYINPRREVPKEATAIHGIATEFLTDKPVFDHVTEKFLSFIQDTKIIIHNAAFDTKFINYELSTLGLPPLNKNNIIDSLTIARNKYPGAANSLDALCKRFNIDLSRRAKHGALLDSELLADVYVELMGGAQSGFALEQNKKNEEEIFSEQERKFIPSRNFQLSADELKQHQEFIQKNIPNHIWKN